MGGATLKQQAKKLVGPPAKARKRTGTPKPSKAATRLPGDPVLESVKGRGSKLPREKLALVQAAHVRGEGTLAGLARAAGVQKGTLAAAGIQENTMRIRELAARLARAEQELSDMPIDLRIIARTLADDLKVTSVNLAFAARAGSDTARKLAVVANLQATKIDPDWGIESDNHLHLARVAALTDTGNEAAKVGLGLLQAVSKSNPRLGGIGSLGGEGEGGEPSSERIPNDPLAASRIYQRMVQS